MSKTAPVRLIAAAKEFNLGLNTIVEFLQKKGHEVEAKPNSKLSPELYAMLASEFGSEKSILEESRRIGLEHSNAKHETLTLENNGLPESRKSKEEEPEELFIRGTSMGSVDQAPKEEPKPSKAPEEEVIKEEAPAPKEKAEKAPAKKVAKKEEAVEEKAEVPAVEKKAEVEDVPETPVEQAVPEAEVETPVAEPISETAPVEEKEELAPETPVKEEDADEDVTPEVGPKVLGIIDLDELDTRTRPSRKSKEDKLKDKALKKKDSERQIQEEKEARAAIKEAEKQTAAKAETDRLAAEETARLETETKAAADKAAAAAATAKGNFKETIYEKLPGPKVLGKIELPAAREKKPKEKKPVASSSDPEAGSGKRKRKRIRGKEVDDKARTTAGKSRGKKKDTKYEPTEEEIQKQMKETLARLTAPSKSKGSKLRKAKREANRGVEEEKARQLEADSNIIKVTEFVTANELANMMNLPVTDVISTCMAVGLFVSINQRLDAETIAIVADEFDFKVEFVSAEVQDAIVEEEDVDPSRLVARSPIVTVMGHVDHGKTSLLDYIRSANVIAGEAGGITQHIGAYEVKLENGRTITFLDTPGHEAFTAMRARGAKITDVAIIVVAADDSVMPQTREAINHAQAAGVPIVFAINKIDKPGANPEKIKEELANMNLLVEDWGGKFQSQDISAKKGDNIDKLLEKVLLEAEMLELQADPVKLAAGTVLESSLDKGRGYVAKVLVQSGTLRIGDMMLAGVCYGKVKAMYNERNLAIKEAGPSKPILMLGLNGAPQAGDTFNVMTDERELKSIATKRQQLQREQGYRTAKHVTLDEIGRRIAIGDFKELQVIVKGDVDGSVEALSDALLKLSTDQVQVNVIHRSVGAVTETDVMLASASDAIIVAFQVRPSLPARKLAEAEQIDIRQYSIIYQATEEIKSAIEGMLSPEIQEKVICNIEVRDVFKITKVGTVAGCMVLDGKVTRNTRIRVIRDGIVIYTGKLGSLKRFKDDVKEVAKGYECGLNVENFNDIKVGDIIEGYEEFEVKRTL